MKQIFPIYRCYDESDRQRLLKLHDQISTLHRHEDTLLNNRLQGFLVTTALLFGGYSQFKGPEHAGLGLAVSLLGLALSVILIFVLVRTARAIEWYLVALNRLDKLLFKNVEQPYRTRRSMNHSINEDGTPRRLGVSRMLGTWLPGCFLALWVLLVFRSIVVLICSIDLASALHACCS